MINRDTVETKQSLTFKLGDELFAINVGQAKDVLNIDRIFSTDGLPLSQETGASQNDQ